MERQPFCMVLKRQDLSTAPQGGRDLPSRVLDVPMPPPPTPKWRSPGAASVPILAGDVREPERFPADIPVGTRADRRLRPVPPLRGIPAVVPGTASGRTGAHTSETVRQAQTPDTGLNPDAPPSVTIMPVPNVGVGINPKGGSMDLGSLIGDIATTYIGARYGNQQVAAPLPYPPAQQQFADVGIPFVDVVREAPAKGYVWNPDANCGQGKWQKKRRRRRSRLATPTDIKDLSSLKGVLGSGEAFKVWIATHSN